MSSYIKMLSVKGLWDNQTKCIIFLAFTATNYCHKFSCEIPRVNYMSMMRT